MSSDNLMTSFVLALRDDVLKRASEEALKELLRTTAVRSFTSRLFDGKLEIFVYTIDFPGDGEGIPGMKYEVAVAREMISRVEHLGFVFKGKNANVFTFAPYYGEDVVLALLREHEK